MTHKKIDFDYAVRLFVESAIKPTKHSIQSVLGLSANTFRRLGFSVRELSRQYEIAIKQQNINSCKQCGKSCNFPNIFCNSSCSAKFHNKSRKIVATCKCCSAELNSGKSFCSSVCSSTYKYQKYIESWLNGTCTSTTKGTGISSYIRKYLFEKYKNKCSCCGWGETNQTSGKVPLEVEHIDGDSQNNSPDNLTLLCPNCHSLTSTYKALNKGKGRHSRRKRYHEGKSY